ncbi:hypothetical protein Taro_022061 [Colocasia esculenta]|uniref:Uncharacterized protein n=1 Tax=Colocasia esculenta TaxID=4460 RepID=A0A843V0N0_COLES|nr:hypothetical protein [Colocasia esculenta]
MQTHQESPRENHPFAAPIALPIWCFRNFCSNLVVLWLRAIGGWALPRFTSNLQRKVAIFLMFPCCDPLAEVNLGGGGGVSSIGFRHQDFKIVEDGLAPIAEPFA